MFDIARSSDYLLVVVTWSGGQLLLIETYEHTACKTVLPLNCKARVQRKSCEPSKSLYKSHAQKLRRRSHRQIVRKGIHDPYHHSARRQFDAEICGWGRTLSGNSSSACPSIIKKRSHTIALQALLTTCADNRLSVS